MIGELISKNIGNVMNIGFNGYNTVSTYSSERKDGHGIMYSAGKAGLETALWLNPVTEPVMIGLMGYDIAKSVAPLAMNLARNNASKITSAYTYNFGGNYQDTQAAYTMRQRGLQAINNGFTNARSLLGNEARTYYRNNMYTG